jgi:hypothetical protein
MKSPAAQKPMAISRLARTNSLQFLISFLISPYSFETETPMAHHVPGLILPHQSKKAKHFFAHNFFEPKIVGISKQ